MNKEINKIALDGALIIFMITAPFTLIYLFKDGMGPIFCIGLIIINVLISTLTPEVRCKCGNHMAYDQFYNHIFFHKLFKTVMCTLCGKQQRIYLLPIQKVVGIINLFIFFAFILKLCS